MPKGIERPETKKPTTMTIAPKTATPTVGGSETISFTVAFFSFDGCTDVSFETTGAAGEEAREETREEAALFFFEVLPFLSV